MGYTCIARRCHRLSPPSWGSPDEQLCACMRNRMHHSNHSPHGPRPPAWATAARMGHGSAHGPWPPPPRAGNNPVCKPTQAIEFIAVGIYVTAIYVSASLLPVVAVRFYLGGPYDSAAWAVTALFLALSFAPLSWSYNALTRAFVRFSCARSGAYFPCRVVCEDEEAFKAGQGYLFGCAAAPLQRAGGRAQSGAGPLSTGACMRRGGRLTAPARGACGPQLEG